MSHESKTDALAAQYDYSEYVGQGLEHAPPPQLPSLRIVHGKSKGLGVAGKPLEKAKIGQIWLSEPFLIGEKVTIIPVNIQRLWQEWASSKVAGGPPLAAYKGRPASATWIEGEGLRTPTGTFIAETHTYYVLVAFDEKNYHKATLHMSKTALPASFEWLRELQRQFIMPKSTEPKKLPLFSRSFNFDTKIESNSENSWHAWHLLDKGTQLNTSSVLFRKGAEFYKESEDTIKMMEVLDPRDLAKIANKDDLPF